MITIRDDQLVILKAPGLLLSHGCYLVVLRILLAAEQHPYDALNKFLVGKLINKLPICEKKELLLDRLDWRYQSRIKPSS